MTTLPDSILRALGWALTHSLWQATVAALVLLLLLTRLQTARQRYRAAYGTLLAVFAAAVGTFLWVFEPVQVSENTSTLAKETMFFGSSLLENPTFDAEIGSSFSNWLEANHLLIVAGWLLGFVFFLLRLGGGLWQVHRLRTRDVRALDAIWQDKARNLSKRIGVHRNVRLFESVRIQVPLTLGYLKPVILLPLGFVNQLSMAEVEAVLAHELAHIARRDWVFNLLQAFIESLFYYHPAVWWMSQIIRHERENACDDAALSATGNPIAFARALVQVQEMATPLPTLALGLSDKRRRPLLERVRRILNQSSPQQKHQAMEKITATVILVALLALVGLRANSVPSFKSALAQISDFPTVLFGEQNPDYQIFEDSLPKPKSTRKITREDEDGQVEAEFQNGRIQRLNIDGRDIPENEFAAHEALIEELANTAPPAPPAPPAPWGNPAQGIWDAPEPPEVPAAHGSFWFHTPGAPGAAPRAPFPPMPPMGTGISIVSDKDEAGNTILNLDNGGGSTRVLIKNGEVWVNGKRLEEGAALDIPGLHFEDGQHFFWDHSASFEPGNLEEMEAHQKAWEAALKVWEKEQKKWARDQDAWHKELEQAQKVHQKQWELEQKKWEAEQKVWEAQHKKWEAKHKVIEAKHKATQERLKKELLNDGLITDPAQFSMRLNAKELKVNNKKQSEQLRKKYEAIIKENSDVRLEGDNWNFNINHNKDEE
jgi:beta-lactamase regulating signal transducer with metallopeptidase domain